MAAIIHMLDNSIFSFIWEQKINILGGLFLGLTVHSYFYRRKLIKKEIIKLKTNSIKLEKIKNNLIITIMETEKYTVKEMVSNMANDFKEFKTEVRQDIKELIQLFHDYKISNNERISLLEGSHKMTKKTIAMYVGFIGAFIMLVVNTYMSFRG